MSGCAVIRLHARCAPRLSCRGGRIAGRSSLSSCSWWPRAWHRWRLPGCCGRSWTPLPATVGTAACRRWWWRSPRRAACWKSCHPSASTWPRSPAGPSSSSPPPSCSARSAVWPACAGWRIPPSLTGSTWPSGWARPGRGRSSPAAGVVQSTLTVAGFLAALLVLSPLMARGRGGGHDSRDRRGGGRRPPPRGDAQGISHAERRQYFYANLLTSLAAAKEIRLFGLGRFFRERMLDELRASSERASGRPARRLWSSGSRRSARWWPGRHLVGGLRRRAGQAHRR